MTLTLEEQTVSTGDLEQGEPTGALATTEALASVRDRLNAALRGKHDVVENVLVCLLAQGHLLLEDMPGLGKTTLAKALASAVGGSFGRVQCTPDLLPSDITGFNLYNQKTHEFDFREGPVFSDILLADEINRATPRTQSALLEAMAERQVTVDTRRYRLAETFFVIATQNPTDQHGTYPLPEAQLDRFAMKLSVGYPATDDEKQMLADAIAKPSALATEPPTSVLSEGQLESIQQATAAVRVADSIQDYLVELGQATRSHRDILIGASPRGLLTLQRCTQAFALISGRDYVIPDDVQHVARPVLSVRLATDRTSLAPLIDELLDTVAAPRI